MSKSESEPVRLQAQIRSPADFGLAIQQARFARGMTQRQLSSLTGISQKAISEMESGRSTIYAERLFALLNACGVTVAAEWEDDAADG